MNAPSPITTPVAQPRLGGPKPAGLKPCSLAAAIWCATGEGPRDVMDALRENASRAPADLRDALRLLAAEIYAGPAAGCGFQKSVEAAAGCEAWRLVACLRGLAESAENVGDGWLMELLADAIEEDR